MTELTWVSRPALVDTKDEAPVDPIVGIRLAFGKLAPVKDLTWMEPSWVALFTL